MNPFHTHFKWCCLNQESALVFLHPIFSVSLWTEQGSSSRFKFKFDAEAPHLLTAPYTEPSPHISSTGLHLIKNFLFFKPLWSLRRVELSVQVEIPATKPALPSPPAHILNSQTKFMNSSSTLQKRSLAKNCFPSKKKEITGV